MNLRKRTLALLLTLCMLLSVVVPMASAEEETGTPSLRVNITDQVTEVAKTGKATFTHSGGYFRFGFKSADAGKSWGAVRIPITGVTEGTYDLQLVTPSTSLAGLTDVYLFNPTDLAGKTGDDLVNYIEGNLNNSTYLGVLDSSIKGLGGEEIVYQNMSRPVSVEEGTEAIILVFKLQAGMSGNKYAYLARLYFTPVATQSNVASNGSTEYATVAAAIEAAKTAADKTVKLIADATADVEVPEGITLDLNGNTLTATEFKCEGTLADNKDGEGLVKTTLGKTINVAATDLLLYDNRDGMDGYRVYNSFTVAPHVDPQNPALQDMSNGAKRLWIKLSFETKEAYEVIAAGNSGIEIGTALSWTPTGGTSVNPTLTFDDDIVKEWAGKMADPNNTKEYGFYIDFTGFGSLAAGTLTLTPFVGNVSSGTPVSYVHAG